MNPSTICILGAYGGAGRALAPLLLRHTSCCLILAGRRLPEARALAAELQTAFPGRRIEARHGDAADPASLRHAFEGASLVLAAATIPEYAGTAARAALDAGADWLDIMISPEVRKQLRSLEPELIRQGRCFITQAGFHPGFAAPLIRWAAPAFSRFDDARLAMTMNMRLQDPAAAREIVEEGYRFRGEVLRSGAWQPASLRDSITADFGPPAGTRSCLPLPMEELHGLETRLGIRNMGVYVSGFNWFVDQVVFSLIYMAGMIRPGLFRRSFQRLFRWGLHRFSPESPWLMLQLDAAGERSGQPVRRRIRISHPDPYLFTAGCVLGCLRTCFPEAGIPPGLHLAGQAADPETMMATLRDLGIRIEVQETGG